MGSTRLPMKSLVTLNDYPIIDWVVTRLQKSMRLDQLVVAVPDTPVDVVLARHLGRRGVPVVRGPENDVLKRMAMAARAVNADVVVRICADNPLIWAPAVDRLVEFYLQQKCDYAWNHIPRNNLWPDGLGAEMVSASLLYEIDHLANLPAQREHCFNYIWDNAENFALETFDPAENWLQRPDVKLDIDTPQDYLTLAEMGLAPTMDAAEIISLWDMFHSGQAMAREED